MPQGTSERPASIAFADLEFPEFSPAVREMLDAMATMGADVVLEVEALTTAARAATGLNDFGHDPSFFDRLDALLGAFRNDANLSDAGRFTSSTQVGQILANRLLVTDFVKRHPAVRDTAIVAPIIIVGLPRTGTTHLHNLMAADPTLRSLPYWESLEPVPTLAEQRGKQPDQRQDRCQGGIWFIDEAMPEFRRMHEMTVEHVHEEIQLLAVDCSTMLFETATCSPMWRDYYKAHDQQPSYDYLKLLLQVCQYQRSGTMAREGGHPRWVLKSPQHLEQIPAVMRTFPDATVVFTHRDPAAVVASFVTMSAYTARISHQPPIDLHHIGTYWRDRILDLYEGCVRDRALVPAAQSIDIHFDDFMSDDIAMVERVYAVAGQPFEAETRAAMAAFMDHHPRGKFGGVEYELQQFGLDASDIRSRANKYINCFYVNLEDRW